MLNHLCTHDCSDDDCYKCSIHGIRFACGDCKDFDDVRKYMTTEQLEERKRLMAIMGWTDKGGENDAV